MKKVVLLMIVLLIISCNREIKKNAINNLKEEVKEKKINFPEKIKIKSFEEKYPKDLLIYIDEIIDYIDFSFNYPKINIKKTNNLNTIIFSSDSLKVIIRKQKFIKKEDKKENFFHGVNYDFPNEVISSIEVSINEVQIKKKNFNYNDLAEPNFKSSYVYKIDKENIVIEMHNSDGAGGYAVYFFVNKSGLVKKYIVFP